MNRLFLQKFQGRTSVLGCRWSGGVSRFLARQFLRLRGHDMSADRTRGRSGDDKQGWRHPGDGAPIRTENRDEKMVKYWRQFS